MKTGDLTLVKQMNKSIVLKMIRSKNPISRAQISEYTGLNKATVSTLVGELMNEDLVYEIGLGQSSGGRRPVMLYFNKNAGYSIGIDVGVNYLLCVLTNLQGNIIYEETLPIKNTLPHKVMDLLKQTIWRLIEKTPPSKYGVVGIGIGVPGFVDEEGTVLFAPNLGWNNVNLLSVIKEEFNRPVVIYNEANAGSVGEKLYGAGKDSHNQVYVSAGIGIGTGIIINNDLYKGTTGFSGEMGHFIIEINGKKCGCGNRGCWEQYASEKALLDSAHALLKDDSNEMTIDSLIELANQGNREVLNLFNEIGEYFGIGLTNIINTFNPELIIIGNRMSKLKEWITNPIERVIEQRALSFNSKMVDIKFSNLGIYSCALGSASFSIETFINSYYNE